MHALTWPIRLFLTWFFISMGLAHATSITVPDQPTVSVKTPADQPGKAPKGFSFDLDLYHLTGTTKGQITFEVVDANNQDKAGLSIPAVAIQTSSSKTSVTARPVLSKEGWYTIKVKTQTNTFKRENTMSILFVDGEVFYDWEGADLVGAIVSHNLAGNKEYAALKTKADQLKSARVKSNQTIDFLETTDQFLSKSEQATFNKIRQAEKDRVLKAIRNKTSVKALNSSKAGPLDPAAGEQVTVKVRWPVDASQASFLPLHGAKIEVINIDAIGIFSNGVFAAGNLDANGEFKFTSPANSLKYRVRITGTHIKFNVMVSDQAGSASDLVVTYDQTPVIDIKTDPANGVPLGFANSWATFQAMYDMATNSAAFTGIAAPSLDRVLTNHKRVTSGVDSFDFGYYHSPQTVFLGIQIPFTSNPEIVLGAGNFFDWDVFSHEYGHAIADQNNSIVSAGGPHTGENQYDYAGNTGTVNNKQLSNRLALNEAYGTWFGVAYWQYSSYGSKISTLGDTKYRDVTSTGGVLEYDLEANTGPLFSYTKLFGEDTEVGLGRLLWDLTDSANEANTRATCSKYCKDDISVPISGLMPTVFKGKQLDGVTDFHKHFYQFYVGKAAGSLDAVGKVDASAMKKTVQIGSVFAEFGVSANINQTNNADPFKDIDAPAVRNLDTSPVQLIWEQHKTGTLGGLDQFEILFYTEALDELIYKVDGVSLAPSGIKYTYQMPKAKVLELVQAVSKLPYKPEQKIVIVIKGTASGGNVSSGPFYGNAEEFTVKLNSRFSVIAVDSSGSNEWNDPSNLRISAGNTMLNNMGLRNDRILAGTEAGKLMSVATIDFDTSVRVLSNFTDPKGLNFNSVDSLGGTDIAAAINRSITLIQAVRPTPNPLPKPDANTPRIYALTDMEGAGNDVTQAILRAGQNNIVFNLGHLVPLVIKAAPADLAGEKMRPKVAEPMDPIIAATLSTGGSYATIETAAAQQAWVDLMDELNNSTPFSRTTINLPLSVKLYGFAQDSGIPEPTYVFTATASGRVTVTVDGKGNFVPALTVDGVSGQNSIGQDQYAREFNVVAGQVYQINLNEDAAASGLYSIVLRQTSTVASPVIQTPTLAPGVVGSAYSPVPLSVVGGTAPFTWTSANLPAGMTLDPTTGALAGTPTAAGTFPFDITVTDSSSPLLTHTVTVSLTVNPAGLSIVVPSTVPDATVGQPYSLQLSPAGGVAPYTWSATGLPAGLSIDGNGLISGTPTDTKVAQAKAALNVTVTLTDSMKAQASQTLTMTVNASPSSTVTPVPTLNEWALTMLGLLAAALGLRARRRHT